MKICTLYNIIEFALQAFLRNLVNYIDNGVPEKMPIFLKLIKDATQMCTDRGFFDCDDSIAKVRGTETHNKGSKCHKILLFLQELIIKVGLVQQKLNEFNRATRMKRQELKARYELETRLEKTVCCFLSFKTILH